MVSTTYSGRVSSETVGGRYTVYILSHVKIICF